MAGLVPAISFRKASWPGYSRLKNGVASLAYGRSKNGIASLAYVPAISTKYAPVMAGLGPAIHDFLDVSL